MSWTYEDDSGNKYEYDIANWTDADGNYHECTPSADNYEGPFSGDWDQIDDVVVHMDYLDGTQDWATYHGPFDGEYDFEDYVSQEVGDGEGSL